MTSLKYFYDVDIQNCYVRSVPSSHKMDNIPNITHILKMYPNCSQFVLPNIDKYITNDSCFSCKDRMYGKL